MDVHAPAVSTLGRALLRLARRGATGTLRVTPRGQKRASAEVRLRGGRVGAVAMADANRLGRFLPGRAEGPAPEEGGPIGERWLAAGKVSRGELAQALRVQMRRRTATLMGWPRVDLAFEPSPAVIPADVEPWDTRDLVLAALREAVRPRPATSRRLRDQQWVLTPEGRRELADAALYPEERAMIVALSQGAAGSDALAIAGEHPRAERALLVWRALGWVQPQRRGDYALLLRKQRELRQRAGVHRLLDLPPDANPTQARRALRRLVRSIHPDRFEPALQEHSANVVRALVAAEASLRGR